MKKLLGMLIAIAALGTINADGQKVDYKRIVRSKVLKNKLMPGTIRILNNSGKDVQLMRFTTTKLTIGSKERGRRHSKDSFILRKNEAKTLPLRKGTNSIATIATGADSEQSYSYGLVSKGKKAQLINPLRTDGFANVIIINKGGKLTYAKAPVFHLGIAGGDPESAVNQAIDGTVEDIASIF